MSDILVTCSLNPDLDGLACVIAYTEFLKSQGKEAEPGLFGEPSYETGFVLDYFNFDLPKKVQNIEDFGRIVLVDVSFLQGLPEKIAIENVIEVIDHRKLNQAHLFVNAEKQIELVGAAATLVAERFKGAGMDISEKSALLLQGAIISNTLNFQSSTTTERDKSIARWLDEKVPLPKDFAWEMFQAKSDLTGAKLQDVLHNDLSVFQKDGQGKRLGIAQIEMLGAEGLVKDRKEEIFKCLDEIKRKHQLDLIFLSIIELKQGFNLFVSRDEQAQKLLALSFGVSFNNGIAKRNGLIMRKEIFAVIANKIN